MSNQTSQKQNLVLYVARISLILLLITACVAAALAGVNAITAPKIAENSQTSKRIRHRYTCAPHPEPSSLLPPHAIPLGLPSAQAQASSIVH